MEIKILQVIFKLSIFSQKNIQNKVGKICWFSLSGCRRFWLFTKLFLDKLAALISQILSHLEEQLFTVICNLTIFWYNPTYAYTYASKNLHKKHSEWIFSFNCQHFSKKICVRLQRSLAHNAILSFTRNFGGQRSQKTKIKIVHLFII
jgi:hypothetical protein